MTATVISLVVSLTLSPALAAVILKPHDASPARTAIGARLHALGERANAWLESLSSGYARLTGLLLRRGALLCVLYAALLVLTGWRVLDAFAGSGALGLEAASRGAQSVTMLEREPALARGIEANVRRLGAQGVSVMAADALVWMKQQARRQSGVFDLVLLDPPFEAGLFDEALGAATDCVPPGGWIYLEAPLPCVSADPLLYPLSQVLCSSSPLLRRKRPSQAACTLLSAPV